jgi:uncharacterized membrane protein
LADNPYSPNGGGDQPTPAAIAQAIAEISEKTSLLLREEIELAKAEVEIKLKSLLKGAVIGLSAGIFVLVGLLFLLHGFAWLAYYVIPVPDQQIFWGFFVVAGVLFVLAALGGFLAAKLFKAGKSPTPTMAIREAQLIKDTVTNTQPQPPEPR